MQLLSTENRHVFVDCDVDSAAAAARGEHSFTRVLSSMLLCAQWRSREKFHGENMHGRDMQRCHDDDVDLKPNSHCRRRCDETDSVRESQRIRESVFPDGEVDAHLGGVNIHIGCRDPVHNSVAN